MNKKDIKIVYMGTPEFSTVVLRGFDSNLESNEKISLKSVLCPTIKNQIIWYQEQLSR